MSSLIFYTDKDTIIVATDTLTVTPEGSLLTFCSKALYLPHLKVIIAGTGVGKFATKWAFKINDDLIVNGLNNLDFHTQLCLQDLWREFQEEFLLPSESTTTIYQFGFNQTDNSVLSYAYRSTNNFTSEQLSYGLYSKPECPQVEEESIINLIPKMMFKQREIQEMLPLSERIFIGGEIQALHLTHMQCSSFKLDQFDDFESNQQEMFDNLS